MHTIRNGYEEFYKAVCVELQENPRHFQTSVCGLWRT